MDADFCSGVGYGHVNGRGVFFEPVPVAFVGEGFATGNAQGGEDSPAANKAGLTGRKADLFDRQQALVVEDIAMDHALSSILIVSEMRQRYGVHKRIGHGATRVSKAPEFLPGVEVNG
jgi:hypothetical protein